ncbi:MAG: MmgE/PrpD family protein [Chloroflexi bacterium]|nr:MmgE/PrpD family protein [Chloroflexota bacterium]
MSTKVAAQFIHTLQLKDIPPEVVQEAKTRILDTLGTTLGGMVTTTARGARAWLESWEGAPEATVFGSQRKMPVPLAAFANGIAASALDYDDGHWAGGHPSPGILPGALALGEARRVSGKRLLEAFVAGWEVYIRIAQLFLENGQITHSTGCTGTFGLAAACAKLLELDVHGTQEALGLAAVQAPLSPPAATAPTGCSVKEGIGWGNMAGVSCALLAERGFIGTLTILDKAKNAPEVTATLGQKYEILDGYIKPYPTGRVNHSPIEATLNLARAYNLKPEQVKQVVVELGGFSSHLSTKRPVNLQHAQYSVPFSIGAALVFRQVTHREIAEDQIKNPTILAIADRVEMVRSPEFENTSAPGVEKYPTRVTVHTTDGRTLSEIIRITKGSPPRRLTVDEVMTKFLSMAVPRLGEQRSAQVIQLVNNLEHIENAGQLANAVHCLE